jgi:hypothetical protein
MHTGSSDQLQSPAIAQVAVFSALRERLAIEVSSSALLAELLKSVALMEESASRAGGVQRAILRICLQSGRASGRGQAVLSCAGCFPTV